MKAFVCTGLTAGMMACWFISSPLAGVFGLVLFFQLLAEIPGTLDKEKDTTAANSRVENK